MTQHFATQFILADGYRARWVKRASPTGDFVTVQDLHNGTEKPVRRPAGKVYESSTGRGFTVAHADAAAKRRAQFAEILAASVNEEVDHAGIRRLAIVAPPRMLSEITQRLSARARSSLSRTLAKDLTKVPDHELGAWLEPMEAEWLPEHQ